MSREDLAAYLALRGFPDPERAAAIVDAEQIFSTPDPHDPEYSRIVAWAHNEAAIAAAMKKLREASRSARPGSRRLVILGVKVAVDVADLPPDCMVVTLDAGLRKEAHRIYERSQEEILSESFVRMRDLVPLRCRVLKGAANADSRPTSKTHDPLEIARGKEVDPLEILVKAALTPGRRVVLLGDLASGKTTLIRRVARRLAERAQETMQGPWPIYFPLEQYGKEAAPALAYFGDLYRSSSVTGTQGHEYARQYGGRAYLVDGLDEVARTQHDEATVNRILKEYLDLASGAPASPAAAENEAGASVIITCRSTLWEADFASRADLLLELCRPTWCDAAKLIEGKHGPEEAARRLRERDLRPLDRAMLNRIWWVAVLADGHHLPEGGLPRMDAFLQRWAEREAQRDNFHLVQSEMMDAATVVAGHLFQRLISRQPGRHRRDPLLLDMDEIMAILSSVPLSPGYGHSQAVMNRELRLSAYFDVIGRDENGHPLFGFLHDDFRFFFTARHLLAGDSGPLRDWLAPALRAELWEQARLFPDDVAGILRYALMMLDDTDPLAVPRVIKDLLDTAESTNDDAAPEVRDDKLKTRVSQLFVVLGAAEGVAQMHALRTNPELSRLSAMKALTAELAELYNEEAGRYHHSHEPFRGDARYYAAQRLSRFGGEFVHVLTGWYASSDKVYQRLFAVEVARQYGVLDQDKRVLDVLCGAFEREVATLAQQMERQRKDARSVIPDEIDRKHLIYHLMEGIRELSELDHTMRERVLRVIRKSVRAISYPVVRALAHFIEQEGRMDSADADEVDGIAAGCLREVYAEPRVSYVQVHAMKAYASLHIDPDEKIRHLATFLEEPAVFIGEEILPFIRNEKIESLKATTCVDLEKAVAAFKNRLKNDENAWLRGVKRHQLEYEAGEILRRAQSKLRSLAFRGEGEDDLKT